ncbi:potassium channel subfamily K member 16-like [Spea bombifrons]|uniref:potassium channel subfamily K member 16-like n=1 Tax=Spea bombifrons TaxID=233779 RepID=UPI00234BF059|nr:potassium channel subfamily K member 16-like [Spea bombifrons]
MACKGTLKSGLLAVAFVSYLLLGAVVFQILEQGAEDTAKVKTHRHRLDFLENYTCLTKDALDHLINVIEDAVKHGINPLAKESENKQTNWDLSSSFFFSGTVVTTIGYGTIAPRTAGGQIFCVFYALFGIPLNVIVLGHVGKKLSTWSQKFGKCLFNKGINKKRAKILTIIFFSATGIIVFIAIPPIVFTRTEGWSYREGIYYAFISLSTIGFGDYVVGYGSRAKKPFTGFRVFVCFWIIFGLAWLSLLFNLLTSLMEDTEKKIAKDIQKKVKHKGSQEEIGMQSLMGSQAHEKEEAMVNDTSNSNGTSKKTQECNNV